MIEDGRLSVWQAGRRAGGRAGRLTVSTSEAVVINTLGGLILRRDEVGHGQVGGRLCSAQKSLIRDALNKHRLTGVV